MRFGKSHEFLNSNYDINELLHVDNEEITKNYKTN